MTGKEIVSDWWITVLSQDDINATDLRGLAVMIDAALAQGRAAEREAIAKLVDDELSLFSCTCCQRVLKAIRARGTP